MESTLWPLLVWSAIWFVTSLLFLGCRRRNPTTTNGNGTLPPGLPGWPVFGNMFDLGPLPHQNLAALKPKYGHLIWLRLGSINTLVVSSPDAAMEMFKNHDLSFCGLMITEAMKPCNVHQASVSLGQYGPHWRLLKRFYSTELFSHKHINGNASIRRKCVDDLIRWISEQEKKTDGTIEIAPFLFRMSFNMIGNLTLSKDLLGSELVQGDEFFHLNEAIVELAGKPNIADFFPSLRWLDPQGLRRAMEQKQRALEIVAGFVKDRIREQTLNPDYKNKDFLGALLEFQGNREEYSGEPTRIQESDLTKMIFELFMAAVDTSNTTMEWTMTELLRNPESMKEVKAELDRVVSRDRRVEESDIDHLHYLQAVMKETLRLHPPIPLLLPRRAVEDTEFMGYWIPENTQVWVNVWALDRDPEAWDEPSLFKPQRFLGSHINFRGQHFLYIPFGAGRRMCPAIPLVSRLVHIVVATLIHSYDWVLEKGATTDDLDMGERMGITLRAV